MQMVSILIMQMVKYPDHADGKYPDHADGKYPDHADGKYPDHADGKYPDHQKPQKPQMVKYPDHADSKYPDHADGKYPDHADDGKYPDHADGKYPDHADGKYPDHADGKYPAYVLHRQHVESMPLDRHVIERACLRSCCSTKVRYSGHDREETCTIIETALNLSKTSGVVYARYFLYRVSHEETEKLSGLVLTVKIMKKDHIHIDTAKYKIIESEKVSALWSNGSTFTRQVRDPGSTPGGDIRRGCLYNNGLEEGQCCGILETIKTSRNPSPIHFHHAPTQFYTLHSPAQMLSVNSSYKSYSLSSQ
ncbi:hypothetical protein J6590_063930 [Homalodisca vitripennis]|nr:hypothetical protein J6590_063930 [Homalodisca vitripennis]